MVMKLSKGVGEIQVEDLKYIWKAPDIYNEVIENNIWLIYGRKGSGKSTLVEYIKSYPANRIVLVLRPEDHKVLQKIISAIETETKNVGDREIEMRIENTLDFILTSQLMRIVCNTILSDTESEEFKIITKFLQQSKMEGTSVIERAINMISDFTGKLILVENLAKFIDSFKDTITFERAKEAFITFMTSVNQEIVLCIDDIDEIGFSYSKLDRLFVNGLNIFLLRNNVNYLKKGSNIRIIVTMPSELYFHSNLWGADKLSEKSACLTWSNTQAIQELVNMRIGRLLNIKKRGGTVYTSATQHTWDKVFPPTIINKVEESEISFDYVLRHTFYTPRNALNACDIILSDFEKNNITPIDFSNNILLVSSIFRLSIEKFTRIAVKDFLDLFGKIYENLDDILHLFSSKPSIWSNEVLLNYLHSHKASLKRRDTNDVYQGVSLIETLQRIGFLGLGTRSLKSVVPIGTERYDLHFSFIEDYPYRGGWDVAVIAPVFYSSYDIRKVEKRIIQPHNQLLLFNRAIHSITNYDPCSNGIIP